YPRYSRMTSHSNPDLVLLNKKFDTGLSGTVIFFPCNSSLIVIRLISILRIRGIHQYVSESYAEYVNIPLYICDLSTILPSVYNGRVDLIFGKWEKYGPQVE